MLRNALRITLITAWSLRLAATRLAPICLVSLCLLPLCAGCAMCSSQDDYTYAAFGGRWQRDDPFIGRVGSVFAPAGAMPVNEEAAADSQPQQTDANTPEDDGGSPEASNSGEVNDEALSEDDDHNAYESDSEAAADAVGSGKLTELSTPSNSTGTPRGNSRSVLH